MSTPRQITMQDIASAGSSCSLELQRWRQQEVLLIAGSPNDHQLHNRAKKLGCTLEIVCTESDMLESGDSTVCIYLVKEKGQPISLIDVMSFGEIRDRIVGDDP